MSLSSADIDHYASEGWIAPIDILGEREAADLLTEFERCEGTYPDQLHAEHRNNAHLVFPFLADLATDSRIVDPVAQILGPDLMLSSTVIFAKPPASDAFVSWHQDAYYMGLEPDHFVTAWIALTPSTVESGCVSVLPGTHRARAEHIDTFGTDNILTRGQQVEHVDASAAVPLELRPGQMSLHHPWLVHGSLPNRSNDRRVGIAMQSYLGPSVRPARGEHHVMHVRGAAVPPSFVEAPRPLAECDSASLDVRAAANNALASVLYDGADEVRPL